MRAAISPHTSSHACESWLSSTRVRCGRSTPAANGARRPSTSFTAKRTHPLEQAPSWFARTRSRAAQSSPPDQLSRREAARHVLHRVRPTHCRPALRRACHRQALSPRRLSLRIPWTKWLQAVLLQVTSLQALLGLLLKAMLVSSLLAQTTLLRAPLLRPPPAPAQP